MPAPPVTRRVTRPRGTRHPEPGRSRAPRRSRTTSTSGRSSSTRRRRRRSRRTRSPTRTRSRSPTNSERSVAVDLADKTVAPEAVGEDGSSDRRASRRPGDLRAAHPRLLDRPTRRCPRTSAARTSRSRGQRGHRCSSSSSPTPASTPCTCCRRSTSPRSRRTAPRSRLRIATLRPWPPTPKSSRPASKRWSTTDGFNWGYDPYHYSVPEGSYAVDPEGGARVGEFR